MSSGAGAAFVVIAIIVPALGMVTMQAFNGPGTRRRRPGSTSACSGSSSFPVAALLAFSAGWGETGVFWSFAIAYSLSAVVGLSIFRRGRWKQKVV